MHITYNLLRRMAALAMVAAAVMLTACDDSTSMAGGSLVQDNVDVIMDSTYTVTGHSTPYTEVPSRTTMQLLGSLRAKGFGDISSDVVTQYMPTATIDTKYVTVNDIDSVKMIMAIYADGFTGDSAMPMGITVHPLTKQLPSPIYSSFDPEGYYDPSAVWGSTTFSTLIKGAELTGADSNGKIFKNVTVTLPVKLGRDLYTQFKEHPETFDTPSSFASWFPGLYITSSFGSGRVTRVDNNVITVYYHRVLPPEVTGQQKDTVVGATATYMGVTPEIITNNNIRLTLSSDITSRVADGEQLVVAPLGYDVEFTFPARKIVEDYKAKAGPLAVINSLSFSIPAEQVANDYGITPPPYLLMVKKSERDKFFLKSQVNDNVTSFYATYNTSTRSYDFSSMRDYVLDLLSKDEIKDEDCDFVLTPVLVAFYENTSSSSYYSYYYYSMPTTNRVVAQISPYVTEPVMARLNFKKAKIKFTFSRQSIKN
ncbi:MAG: DUF4270 domain-containing protein [Duncaniella sp.]|nr:DUF4270 domain-containing protein [Duncaniella sp.]